MLGGESGGAFFVSFYVPSNLFYTKIYHSLCLGGKKDWLLRDEEEIMCVRDSLSIHKMHPGCLGESRCGRWLLPSQAQSYFFKGTMTTASLGKMKQVLMVCVFKLSEALEIENPRGLNPYSYLLWKAKLQSRPNKFSKGLQRLYLITKNPLCFPYLLIWTWPWPMWILPTELSCMHLKCK